MTFRADFTVRDTGGSLVAVAEVKNSQPMTIEIARSLRHNLIESGSLPVTPYFLIVSQHEAFVWDQRSGSDSDAPPTARIPMRTVFERYLPRFDLNQHVRGRELAYGVAQWLNDLTQSTNGLGVDNTRDTVDGGDMPLEFAAAIHGGAIALEDPV